MKSKDPSAGKIIYPKARPLVWLHCYSFIKSRRMWRHRVLGPLADDSRAVTALIPGAAGVWPLASGWFFRFIISQLLETTSASQCPLPQRTEGEETELQSSHLPRVLGRDTFHLTSLLPTQYRGSPVIHPDTPKTLLSLSESRSPSQLGSKPEGTCFPLQKRLGPAHNCSSQVLEQC